MPFDQLNPSPLLRFDAAGRILDANSAARAAFPDSTDEGAHLAQVFPDLADVALDRIIAERERISRDVTVGENAFRLTLVGYPEKSCGHIYVTDISELRQTQEVMRMLLGVANAVNRDDVPASMTYLLGATLNVRAVWAGELERGSHAFVQTVALCAGGQLLEDQRYPLTSSPCEELVTSGKRVVVADRLRDTYEKFELAEAYKGVSYLGVPLLDAAGVVIGVLAAIDDRPMTNAEEIYTTMHVMAGFIAADLERRQSERRTRGLLRDYEKQNRELSCLSALAESVRAHDDLRVSCEQLVESIPSAWSAPDAACARVLLGDDSFESPNFVATRWGQSAAIVSGDRSVGMVQVFYQSAPGTAAPFLPSERKLLDAIARTLGEAYQRRIAEGQERKKTRALAQERNQLEVILRKLGEGVVVTDSDHQILMMNAAAQRMLENTGDEPVGVDFRSLLLDMRFVNVWNDSAAEGTDFQREDLIVPCAGQRTLTATRTRIPLVAESGDGYVTILHDVTKQRRIAQMKTDFVSAITHDLRTPMTSIKGFVSTLLRKPDIVDDKRNRFLRIIDEEAERLTRLIEELLLISRIEAGAMLLDRDIVRIGDVIGAVAAGLEPISRAKDVRVRMHVPEQLPEMVADEEKVRAVLFNLIENAIKFAHDGGEVIVRAAVEEDAICIEIEDDGPGIPPEEQEQIFDRFYRVEHPGREIPGTGLGLFIVREMVALHDGKVSVRSQMGAGAVFTVSLPLAPASESAPAIEESLHDNG